MMLSWTSDVPPSIELARERSQVRVCARLCHKGLHAGVAQGSEDVGDPAVAEVGHVLFEGQAKDTDPRLFDGKVNLFQGGRGSHLILTNTNLAISFAPAKHQH